MDPSPKLLQTLERALVLVERWTHAGETVLLEDLNALASRGSGEEGTAQSLNNWPPWGAATGRKQKQQQQQQQETLRENRDAKTAAAAAGVSAENGKGDSKEASSSKNSGSASELFVEKEAASHSQTLTDRLMAAAKKLAQAALGGIRPGGSNVGSESKDRKKDGANSATDSSTWSPDPVVDPFAYLSEPSEIRAALLSTASRISKTCRALYSTTSTGLAPEIVTFEPGRDFTPNSDARHSFLRPEAVESFFVLRALGLEGPGGAPEEDIWPIFTAMERHARVRGGGHATVKDVSVGPFGPNGSDAPSSAGISNMVDKMDSFVLAETYKYIYMLSTPNDQLTLPPGTLRDLMSLKGWVLNTEAHPVRVRGSGPSAWREILETLERKYGMEGTPKVVRPPP